MPKDDTGYESVCGETMSSMGVATAARYMMQLAAAVAWGQEEQIQRGLAKLCMGCGRKRIESVLKLRGLIH